jgi:hypothetical protein
MKTPARPAEKVKQGKKTPVKSAEICGQKKIRL